MGITNLEEQFTFYASYHHSTMNKIIHIFCVWPILWSAFVLTEYIPLSAPPQFNTLGLIHPVNLTFLAAVFYAAVYISMDKRAGSLAALLVLGLLVHSRKFYINSEADFGLPAWQIATLVHVACWIAQFVGHGAFEGRAPALFDNLMQALVMAPLFVLLEVLFPLGYRKDFQKKVWKNVEKEIAKHKLQAGGKKAVSNGKRK